MTKFPLPYAPVSPIASPMSLTNAGVPKAEIKEASENVGCDLPVITFGKWISLIEGISLIERVRMEHL